MQVLPLMTMPQISSGVTPTSAHSSSSNVLRVSTVTCRSSCRCSGLSLV